MKRFILILFFLLLATISISQSYYHFPAEHFDVYYQQSVHDAAVQLIQQGDEIYKTLTDFYGITLKKRLKVYLLDTVDFANAYADIFSNAIIIYTNRSSSDYYNNTYKWWVPFVFSHELTHILLANKSDWMKDLLGLFGHPVSVLFDTAFTPSFLHEGVSIYSESLLFEKGRLNDSRYLSYLKAEIQDNGFRGLSLAGGMTSPDFTPIGFNYLYGSFFVKYLEETFGEQAVSKMVNEYGNEYRFNFIRMIEDISGSGFSDFISAWKAWLYSITSMEKISENYIYEKVTESIYYSGLSAVSDSYLYYFVQVPGAQTKLYRRNDESISSKTLPIPTNFAVSPSDNIAIIYANSNGYEQYDLSLYIGGFKGSFKRLEEVKRPQSVEWLDDETLIYTFLEKGGTGLATYNIITEKIAYYLSPNSDFYINNMSSYDGRMIMSITYNGNADLYELDLETDKLSVVMRTPENEIDPFLYSDGVLYASDKEGEYNIYFFDELKSSCTKLTDSEFGAYKPVFFNGDYYFRSYSGKGFVFNRLLSSAEEPLTIEQQRIEYVELNLDEDPVYDSLLKNWDYQQTLLPIPRFGIPALFALEDKLIGVAGIAGWDDMKEWIWYGYLGGIGDYFVWDYSLIHRGFPDFQLTWNGTSEYEELSASFRFPFALREDERAAYIEPALNLGINHTSDDLPWKPITDFYLHQAFKPIVYPDNPISVPQFQQIIQLGTSGFFSQSAVGLALPYSMTGMISQTTAYSKTILTAESWYPLNFISPVGTQEGKFRLSSPVFHFGLSQDLSKEIPYAIILGMWIDIGVQYWLDFRLTLDFYIGEEIQPKIGIQNSLMGMI